MTDLRQRLRDVEELEPPDLWSDIEHRRPRPLPPAPPSHRGVTIVVAVLVTSLGAALLADAFRGDRQVEQHVGSTAARSFDFSGAPVMCLSGNHPGLITCRRAVALSRNSVEASGTPTEIVARLTNYRRRSGASPVVAWIVTWRGVNVGSPDGPPPGPEPNCLYIGDSDVVLNASSGEAIVEGTIARKTICPSPSAPEASTP